MPAARLIPCPGLVRRARSVGRARLLGTGHEKVKHQGHLRAQQLFKRMRVPADAAGKPVLLPSHMLAHVPAHVPAHAADRHVCSTASGCACSCACPCSGYACSAACPHVCSCARPCAHPCRVGVPACCLPDAWQASPMCRVSPCRGRACLPASVLPSHPHVPRPSFPSLPPFATVAGRGQGGRPHHGPR
eukprot:359300-Chlamydomonas_euryale.AAC.5